MAPLTQQQMDSEIRLQQSLDSLWAWIEELDKNEDEILLMSLQRKINNLLTRLGKKLEIEP